MWGVLICNFVAIVAAELKLQARETRRVFVTSLLRQIVADDDGVRKVQ